MGANQKPTQDGKTGMEPPGAKTSWKRNRGILGCPNLERKDRQETKENDTRRKKKLGNRGTDLPRGGEAKGLYTLGCSRVRAPHQQEKGRGVGEGNLCGADFTPVR